MHFIFSSLPEEVEGDWDWDSWLMALGLMEKVGVAEGAVDSFLIYYENSSLRLHFINCGENNLYPGLCLSSFIVRCQTYEGLGLEEPEKSRLGKGGSRSLTLGWVHASVNRTSPGQ